MNIDTRYIKENLLEITIEAGGGMTDELITSKQEAIWLISKLESVIDDLRKYPDERRVSDEKKRL